MNDSQPPCPMCGEMILASAAKCQFCNEVFDPAPKKAKSKKKSKKYGPGDKDLSGGDIAVALLCSGIGCIAGLVWMVQGKPKGLKMFGLSLAMNIFWGVVRLVIQQSTQPGGP